MYCVIQCDTQSTMGKQHKAEGRVREIILGFSRYYLTSSSCTVQNSNYTPRPTALDDEDQGYISHMLFLDFFN